MADLNSSRLVSFLGTFLLCKKCSGVKSESLNVLQKFKVPELGLTTAWRDFLHFFTAVLFHLRSKPVNDFRFRARNTDSFRLRGTIDFCFNTRENGARFIRDRKSNDISEIRFLNSVGFLLNRQRYSTNGFSMACFHFSILACNYRSFDITRHS